MRSFSLALPLLAMVALLSCFARAQSAVYYDFDNAPSHTSLPQALTVDGVTAHFSSSPAWYNYSFQPANTLGFTPAGFAGQCIYPNQVYACDLLIAFDNTQLTDLSVLYAPEEYATDSSCTMRVTAFLGGAQVATATHVNPNPGTWPSDTLAIHSASPFDNVVIHYDKAPITGGDYGPIFMVDNLQVTTAVPEPAGMVAGFTAIGLLAALRRASRGSRSLS